MSLAEVMMLKTTFKLKNLALLILLFLLSSCTAPNIKAIKAKEQAETNKSFEKYFVQMSQLVNSFKNVKFDENNEVLSNHITPDGFVLKYEYKGDVSLFQTITKLNIGKDVIDASSKVLQALQAGMPILPEEGISVIWGDDPSWFKIMNTDGIQVGSSLLTHKNQVLYSYILIGANMDQELAEEFLTPVFPHLEKMSLN